MINDRDMAIRAGCSSGERAVTGARVTSSRRRVELEPMYLEAAWWYGTDSRWCIVYISNGDGGGGLGARRRARRIGTHGLTWSGGQQTVVSARNIQQ